jgi:Tol biopolymer transport system component
MILWDSRSGQRVAALRGLAGPLAWSPDGKRLAVGSYRPGETAAVCEGASGNRQAILACRLAPISLARPAWLPNGKAIVATAGEGLSSSAVRWDVETGKLQARMSGIGEPWEPIRDLRLSPDGKYVAAATGSLGFMVCGMAPARVGPEQ